MFKSFDVLVKSLKILLFQIKIKKKKHFKTQTEFKPIFIYIMPSIKYNEVVK